MEDWKSLKSSRNAKVKNTRRDCNINLVRGCIIEIIRNLQEVKRKIEDNHLITMVFSRSKGQDGRPPRNSGSQNSLCNEKVPVSPGNLKEPGEARAPENC